jgi:hypothetical protein
MTIITEIDDQRQDGESLDTDPVELLERAAAAGEDVYQAAVGLGQMDRESKDRARWRIGDLARLVTKAYGQNRIADFAKDINEPVDRVKEYRTVCRYWERSVRADFLALPTLTYSHFRIALRFADREDACDFLQDCAANAWTVEAARIELKKRLGEPLPAARLLDAEARVVIVRTDPGLVPEPEVTFELLPGVDLLALENLHGRHVRLVVTEVKDA